MSDASTRTFDGYRRPDGRAGVRNHVLVLSPTGLTSAAAARIGALVRGTVCVTSGYGRGQVAADAQLQFDTLSGLACHPNIAATLVVSAGPDITQSYVDAIASSGKPVAGIALPDVREDALALVDAGVRVATRMVREAGGDTRAQNPGPQNRAGGLTTLEEKALGAIAKGGRQRIHGLLQPAQRPSGAGLFLMDTPYFSPESITAMVAGGAQIVLFTTGAGNSYCSLIAPTLKISANPQTCARLTEQIDIPAAYIVDGSASLDDVGAHALEQLIDVASGTLTFGEIVGEGSEVVSRVGPSI